MRKMSKVFAGLAAMAAAVVLVMPVQAAPKPYTYTVRVFQGNRGTIAGASGADGAVVYDGAGAVTFDAGQVVDGADQNASVTVGGNKYEVTVTDPKYYAKGIRISGKDSIIPSHSAIDEDADYVIAYGVLSDRVEYTVRYLDTNGNELAASRTYFGNAGDKPIVAFLNIDGYVPNAYNITKTLVKGEDNIFTFTYTRRATGGGGGGGDTTVYDEETVTTTNTTPVIVPGAGGDAAGAAGGGVTVVPGDGGAADAGAGDAGEAAAPAEPEQLVDLDDEEVPLANVPGSNGGSGIGSEPGSFFVNLPPAVIVGIVSMAVLAVAAAWYLLFMRKKKGTGEDEQE